MSIFNIECLYVMESHPHSNLKFTLNQFGVTLTESGHFSANIKRRHKLKVNNTNDQQNPTFPTCNEQYSDEIYIGFC